jgi:hypothetical protein
MSLQKTIESLAADFVKHVIAALKDASLQEVASVTGKSIAGPAKAAMAAKAPKAPKAKKAGKKGRLPRRSPEDIARALDQIVAAVKAAPKGLRAEQIQAKLGIDKRELPRPVAEGLASKRLVKKGKKRATTYFVGPNKKKA